ncbi:MAG: insulinase family protein [Deltaproteobacteria bacterium]|nr:MAG: insulinase family protein [Deltaproteobacteria bacterium]
MTRLVFLALFAIACAPKQAPAPPSTDQVVPVPGPPKAFTPAPPVQRALGNGIPVFVVEQPSLPLVSVRLLLPTGTSNDPVDQAGRASLGTAMLDEAAGPRSALEQAAALDAIATSVGISAGRESTTLYLDTHRDTLAEALPLAADALLRPGFLEADFARVHQQQLSGLRSALDNNTVVAGLVGASQWWGQEHPYGLPTQGSLATVQPLTLEDLRAWHAQEIHAGGAAIVVVGDVRADEVTGLLDEHFGSWVSQPRAAKELPAPSAPTGVVLVDRPGSSQTVISILMPGRGVDDPQRAEIDAVRTILGGSFTSRLNRRLREELGYTYGARMSVARYHQGGTLGAGASVRTDATADALVEFMKLLRAAQRDGVTGQDAHRGRALMITSAVDQAETRSGLAAAYGSEILQGRSPADLATYLAQVDALDQQAITQAAVSIAPEQALVVLVGDRAQIEAPLRELGFEDLRIVVYPQKAGQE